MSKAQLEKNIAYLIDELDLDDFIWLSKKIKLLIQ